MGIESVATQLYNIQSRKRVPLKTAIGIMAREELAARFSVYNLVRTVTRSSLLATVAERSFGKGTPLQRKQAEEENKRERSEKRFKAFTVNSLVNLNNRINLLAAVTERNTMLIAQLFGEMGNYKTGRKFNPLGGPSAMRIPLRNKSIKGKLEEIQKSLDDLKKSKGKLGAPLKKKKEKKPPTAEPAKTETGGLFGFLSQFLGSGGALGALAETGIVRLLLGALGTGATAASLFSLGGSIENLKQRLSGENVNEDPFIEGISQGKDNVVLTTAAGGLTAAATMGIPLAYRIAKKAGKAVGLDQTKLGQKFSSMRADRMNAKQLKYIEKLEKRYISQGMFPDAARNKAFESANKAMSGRFGESATRFLTGKPDPKWLMVNKILVKAAKVLPVVSAGLVAYEVSSMAGHHADYENQKIDYKTYKEKMSDGYSSIIQVIGVPAATTLLGSVLGTAFGGPLGTLGGTALGIVGGLGLSFFADKPADYVGEKIFEMIHEKDVPPEIVADAKRKKEEEMKAEGVGGGMPAAAPPPTTPPSPAGVSVSNGDRTVGAQVSSLETQAATISELKGVSESGSAKEAMAFFMAKGWTEPQAAGIVGNLMAESGAQMKTNSVGDGGKAYGIAQWHPPRQKRFADTYGKIIHEAGFQEQMEFVHWELNNDEAKAGKALRKATDASTAAYIVDVLYERSAGHHRQKRIDYANQLMDKKYVDTVATTGQRAAVTGSGSVMSSGGTGTSGKAQPQGVGTPAPQTVEEKKVDNWAWSVYSGQATMEQVPPSIAETVKKRLENVPSHWAAKRDEMNEPVDVAPATGAAAGQSVEQIDTEYTNTVTKLQELVGQGKLSQAEFAAQVEALDRSRREKRTKTAADRSYEASVSALQTSRKENKITDAEFKRQVEILDKARKERNRQLISERQKGPESTQTAVQYLEMKFPKAKDRTMYWVNGVRYARSVNSSTGKGYWYISYQEGKKKTFVNPEAAVILAKNKWTGPDKTLSDANAIFEAERAQEAKKVDSGERRKAEPTSGSAAAPMTPTTTPQSRGFSVYVEKEAEVKIAEDSDDVFKTYVPQEEAVKIDTENESAAPTTTPAQTPAVATPTSAVQTPAGDATTTSTSTSETTRTESRGKIIGFRKEDYPEYEDYYKKALAENANDPRLAAKEAELRLKQDLVSGKVEPRGTTKVEPSSTSPAVASPAAPETPASTPTPLVVDGKSSADEEEIPEVMVTATPRKMPKKPEQVQETATPAETDPLMGAGINYGETARPTKFIIEGFRPKDYPDEYFPALRRYLAGTNIGSKKARIEAEQKASEDIKQAILAGSIRPRGKTKLVSVETTFEALTPQTRFQQEPSAEPMSLPIPRIESSSSQTALPPPDTSAEEREMPIVEDLTAKIDGLQQQVAAAFQSTNTLAASTSKLGKKVAENTQAMDNSIEFRTARNLDSGIASYRSV